MSQRIELNQTPVTHPGLYQVIPASEVRDGDIFRGQKNPNKWYQHDENSGTDSWRIYYRRKGMAVGSGEATTGAPAETGINLNLQTAGVGSQSQDRITLTLTVQIPVADVKRFFQAKEDPFGDGGND